MPVVFNEPLSFLQRISEYMEHTHLIHKACSLSDSIDRMQVGIKIFLLDSVLWASICQIDKVTRRSVWELFWFIDVRKVEEL